MNRKERRASGVKGKKGDEAVINNAIDLARNLMERKEREEAYKLYEKILTYDPDNIPALFDVGCNYLDRGVFTVAEEHFNKVLALNDQHAGALTCLATLRLDQGRRDEALQLAEKARQYGAHSHHILIRLGNFYRSAGMLDRAKEFMYTALQVEPSDVSIYNTLLNTTKSTPEDVAALKILAQKKDLNLKGKTILQFTLGKACMDTGLSDEAFWHYAEGNLMKRATYTYDAALQAAYIDSIINIFTPEVVERLRGKGTITSDVPIFVIGMPRSGSTLVDQILSSHPDVGSVGESRFFSPSVPAFPNKEVPEFVKPGSPNITKQLLTRLNGKMLDNIAKRYMGKMEPFVGKSKKVVDKMLFNFLWLGLIRLALPNAKIVNCNRDPIDIGLSIWGILFSDDLQWAYDQKDIAQFYLSYHKLMNHWRKLFPGEFYDVHYEKMVADQENESRKLLEFCGLSWDDSVLRFHESTRGVKTASVMQVRKPIYKDSVKKWKKHEKHLQVMIDAVAAELPEILK